MIGRVEVDEKSLARLVAALRSEADGKDLTRDLVRNLRAVAEPAAQAARTSLLGMQTSGRYESEPPLLATVAAHTKVSVHVGGRHPGVAIRADKRGMPREFRDAPSRLNSPRGWRHKVFGTERWVWQRGKPGWFDDTIARYKPAAQRAAARAMDDMARRISDRTKG